MRKCGIQGFGTRQWMISDHDPSVAYLSKAAWDAGATPRAVYADQVRAVCGEAAVEPMLEMFREIEAVTTALEDHGMGLTFPHAGMMMRQWSPEPMPKELADDRATYQRALAAVRRAPTPSRPEGKAYVQYWTGRLRVRRRVLRRHRSGEEGRHRGKGRQRRQSQGRQSRVSGEAGRGRRTGQCRPRRRLQGASTPSPASPKTKPTAARSRRWPSTSAGL